MKFRIIRKKLRALVQSENGGALAELAILVPFLAVMLAGVAEFGRFFHDYSTLAKATRASSRYLSNHALTNTEFTRAKNLVVCGKLVCGVSDPVQVTGLTSSNVCIETVGSPKVTSVTVRIPRVAGNCGTSATAVGGTAASSPYTYQPVFDIGALLNTSLTLALPIAPSTTMYYMVN